MIIYSIYKVVNKVNGKVYIGFDSAWPSRQKTHYYKSNSNKSSHFQLHHAIRKYGWESFDWEVIYQSKDREHTLKIMEPLFIEQYNSFESGYNQTLGGEGTFGKLQSEKNKKFLSEKLKSRNKNSRWYNNGTKNTFTDKHPGINWVLGRINQKPSTKGYKWYNNGVEQKLTNQKPEGWVAGML
jgi:group I intron endonuclease